MAKKDISKKNLDNIKTMAKKEIIKTVERYVNKKGKNELNGKYFSHCPLCGAPILLFTFTENEEYHSHNAEPLIKGRCCGKCNATKVVPYRMQLISKGLGWV